MGKLPIMAYVEMNRYECDRDGCTNQQDDAARTVPVGWYCVAVRATENGPLTQKWLCSPACLQAWAGEE